MADVSTNTRPAPVHLCSLDLPSLSIHDLWCLADMYERLAETAGHFLNQPRFTTGAGEHADHLWNDVFHRTRQNIIEELRHRVPRTEWDSEKRAEAVMRYMVTIGDGYRDIVEVATEALAFTQKKDRAA